MSLDAGSRLGHYDVTAKLGAGGMGEVWQATDTQLNRQVALKILPDAVAADPDRLARFQREAQLLASLNHPGIAAIYGIETAGDTRALVMELVAGATLADLIARGPLAVDDALPIAKQIAEALEAAHDAGVIHRDLKPANIKVRDDGKVKVLDFGLAKRLANETVDSQTVTRDALTEAGVIVGTPAYMAPEQILGGEATACSDIFSFGVVLYELLSQTHPFLKEQTSATMAAIVRDPPTPPGGGVAPQLARLFDMLLAKEPGDRYQSFGDVSAELGHLLESTEVRSGEAAAITGPGGGRRTAFVGREQERAELERRIDDAVRGRGGVLLIGGEPGVGKTRLVEQALEMARRRRCVALTGRCYEMAGTPPFMPFVETLEESARVVPAAALREALGDAASEVARLMPDLRRLFPDIPPAINLPPEQQRHYLFKHYTEFLARASRIRPLIVLVDDLQWADEPTLHLLQHVSGQLAGLPILLIGTYRDVELDGERPFAAVLETLTRKRLAQTLTLGPLTRDDVTAMLAALVGQSPPDPVVEAIYETTEGNPFFVEEVFQHLEDDARLLDQGGWRSDLEVDELDVPRGVQAVIGRRLERLSDEGQRVLTLGAVVGRGFALELLEAAGDVTGDPLLTALEEAEAHALIVPVSKREAKWEFSHGLIRQTLVGGLSVRRRQRWHLQVAEALERLTADGDAAHVSDLAEHFYQAGPIAEAAKTVRYLTAAGDGGLDAAAHEEALRHFEAALELVPSADGAGRAALLLKRVTANRGIGRWEHAREDATQAMYLFGEVGDLDAAATACCLATNLLIWAGQVSEAADLARRGLDLVGPGASLARSRLLVTCAAALYTLAERSAELEPADAMVSESAAILGTIADSGPQQDNLGLAAWRNHQTMRRPEHAEAALASADIAGQVGDLLARRQALALCQMALVNLGRLDEAARYEEESERLGQRFRDPIAEINTVFARGQREWLSSGNLDQLETWARRGLEVCATGVPWGFFFETWLALANISRGHWAEARDQAQEATDREPPGCWAGVGWSVLFLSECLLGHRETAMALLDTRRDRLPSAGSPSTTGAWNMLFGVVEGLAVLGDRDAVARLYPAVVAGVDTGTLVDFNASCLLQKIAGIAAAAGGQWDDAESHYETALEQAHAIPFRSEQPEVRRWYAQMLIDRGEAADRDRARTMLAEAVEAYGAIGMPKHAAMAKALSVLSPGTG